MGAESAEIMADVKDMVHTSISKAYTAGFNAGKIAILEQALRDIRDWHNANGYNHFEHRTIDNVENYLCRALADLHMGNL